MSDCMAQKFGWTFASVTFLWTTTIYFLSIALLNIRLCINDPVYNVKYKKCSRKDFSGQLVKRLRPVLVYWEKRLTEDVANIAKTSRSATGSLARHLQNHLLAPNTTTTTVVTINCQTDLQRGKKSQTQIDSDRQTMWIELSAPSSVTLILNGFKGPNSEQEMGQIETVFRYSSRPHLRRRIERIQPRRAVNCGREELIVIAQNAYLNVVIHLMTGNLSM